MKCQNKLEKKKFVNRNYYFINLNENTQLPSF